MIIDAAPAAVQANPDAGLRASVRRFIAEMVAEDAARLASCRAYAARLAVQTDADDTTDHAEKFEPTPADAEWWASVCDHSDWPRDGELSPKEQDAELEHLDRYNDALEAMYAESIEADRIEAGCYAW